MLFMSSWRRASTRPRSQGNRPGEGSRGLNSTSSTNALCNPAEPMFAIVDTPVGGGDSSGPEDGEGEDFLRAFKRVYKSEFGFLLETKNIIVDDIRVTNFAVNFVAALSYVRIYI